MLRLTLCLVLFIQPVLAGDLSDSVSRVMDQARKDGAEMTLPVNKHHEKGLKAAKETANRYYSPEFQEKLQCEQKRLKEEVFADFVGQPPAAEEKKQVPGKLAAEEKVFLFISSSMPDETVQAYLEAIAQADEPNLVALMRGFVPGKRGKYLIRIIKKDLSCEDQVNPKRICERYEVPIKLAPSLFEKYGITQVPAVVYESGEDAWKISGDSALDYLLDRINRDAHKKSLEGLISTIRGS